MVAAISYVKDQVGRTDAPLSQNYSNVPTEAEMLSGEVSDVTFQLSAGATEITYQVGALALDVEVTNGEYVATEPHTGMYGEGDDEVSAVMNLLRSLHAMRQTLREHEGATSPDLAADLEFLEQHLWR